MAKIKPFAIVMVIIAEFLSGWLQLAVHRAK